jgi:DNA-binding transcriptional MerR regulator
MDRHLSPAETAKRFGLSIKALRLYEDHGLLKPLRTTNGTTGAAWRVYGPAEIARLTQILALKRYGLSLTQIGELLGGRDALDPILAFQERSLVADSERTARALTLIRKARTNLARGASLSIDDLTTLSQETVMTKEPTAEEKKRIIEHFRQKHLTPEENAGMHQWRSDHADGIDVMKSLMQEAKALMEKGDTTSPAAMDFAARLRESSNKLKATNPPLMNAVTPKWKGLVDDMRADPQASEKLSPILEVTGFLSTVLANLKAQEEKSGRG